MRKMAALFWNLFLQFKKWRAIYMCQRQRHDRGNTCQCGWVELSTIVGDMGGVGGAGGMDSLLWYRD